MIIICFTGQPPIVSIEDDYDNKPYEGMFIDISARIISNDAPVTSVKWGVIGRDLPSSAEITTYNDSILMGSRMFLDDITTSDTGNYTITAGNEYGTSVAIAPVQVLKGML